MKTANSTARERLFMKTALPILETIFRGKCKEKESSSIIKETHIKGNGTKDSNMAKEKSQLKQAHTLSLINAIN